jgi:hypothetical protein
MKPSSMTSKQPRAKTFEAAPEHPRIPLVDPAGKTRIQGHTPRASGAQGLSLSSGHRKVGRRAEGTLGFGHGLEGHQGLSPSTWPHSPRAASPELGLPQAQADAPLATSVAEALKVASAARTHAVAKAARSTPRRTRRTVRLEVRPGRRGSGDARTTA